MQDVIQFARHMDVFGNVVVIKLEIRQVEQVLEEFNQLTMAGNFIMRGGFDYAKKVLMSAFPPDTAKKLLDGLTKAGLSPADVDALTVSDDIDTVIASPYWRRPEPAQRPAL